MDKLFSDWLLERMKENRMTQADLARSSGLTRQAISYYLGSKSKSPDEIALQKIAHAFALSPEEVFRAAGLLPPKRDESPLDSKINFLISTLPTEQDKEDVLRYVEMRHQLAEERGRSNAQQEKTKPSKP